MTAIRALEVDDLPDVLTLSLRLAACLRLTTPPTRRLDLPAAAPGLGSGAGRRSPSHLHESGPRRLCRRRRRTCWLRRRRPRRLSPPHGRCRHDRGRSRLPAARDRPRDDRLAAGHMRRSGMDIAVVETGGDPGHAPARRAYEAAGYTLLPIARYFQLLHEDA